MEARITVHAEHLAGPCEVTLSVELEPNSEAWNKHTYHAMVTSLNDLLAEMFDERDNIRFDQERAALRNHRKEEQHGDHAS